MTERTTVRLPDDLVRRAKRKAADEGRSLASLIEEGLRRIVAEQPPRSPNDRILPPVSKASGGLRPGIDLNKTALIQEMDDLDHIGRMK